MSSQRAAGELREALSEALARLRALDSSDPIRGADLREPASSGIDPFTDLGHRRPRTPIRQLVEHHPEVLAQSSKIIAAGLREYVSEGSISLATAQIEGGRLQRPITDLVEKLIDIAAKESVDDAVDLFEMTMSATGCPVRGYTIVGGATLESSLELYDGIRMERKDEHDDIIGKLPFRLLYTLTSPEMSGDAVMIIEDWNLSPLFARPSTAEASTAQDGLSDPPTASPMALPLSREGPSIGMHLVSKELSGFNSEQFCRALSLAACHRIYPSMMFRRLPDREFTRMRRDVRTVTGTTYYPENPLSLTSDDVSEAKRLYELMMSRGDGQLRRLQISMDRLRDSRGSKTVVDRAVDLGMALEVLLLPDQDGELLYRMRIRAARFLADDFGQRDAISKLINQFYKVRSKAVHTGTLADKRQSAENTIADTQQICQELIVKILEQGWPDWPQVEFS